MKIMAKELDIIYTGFRVASAAMKSLQAVKTFAADAVAVLI
jgi:hypothetical protein